MFKNAKFSGYYFHMNPNIQWHFQICFSVPLKELQEGQKLHGWAKVSMILVIVLVFSYKGQFCKYKQPRNLCSDTVELQNNGC